MEKSVTGGGRPLGRGGVDVRRAARDIPAAQIRGLPVRCLASVTISPRPVLLPEAAGGVEVVARFFRALGEPARLRLLEFLLDAEHTVSECVTLVGLSQGRVSAHLACLAGCGYVEGRRDGRFTWYKVADPRVADLVVLARSIDDDRRDVRPH